MWTFIGVTLALFLGLVFMKASMSRDEIMANWSMYKNNPFYMFAAPMFKPDDDPRSRLQFGADTFNDAILEMLNKVFITLLQPVFKIFSLFTDALTQSLSGLFSIKSLLSNMWNKWNSMSDVFTRRFQSVFHNFRVTFTKIFNAMEKSYGVAVSSLFAGISTIHTMTSFLDLVIKIIITILIILVVMVILLFFVLAPFVPLIITVIGIVAATAMGGAVGGMAGAFCFTPETLIMTTNGPVRIDKVKLGTELSSTNRITGLMRFAPNTYDLYYLDGICVSGTHIIYYNGKPIHVKDHPKATRLFKETVPLYCLITSEHTIPIVGSLEIHTFADWEELDTEQELSEWYTTIFSKLNNKTTIDVPSTNTLCSESAVALGTLIDTPSGPVPIEHLRPGTMVLGITGATKVLGTVQLDPSSVQACTTIGETQLSAGSWVFANGVWDHPTSTTAPGQTMWYSLFTESGTYQVHTQEGSVSLRDFSDIGNDEIAETYDMVQQFLEQRSAFFQNDV